MRRAKQDSDLEARVSNAVARESYEIDFMSSPVGLSEGIR